jgi:hypothetical protein
MSNLDTAARVYPTFADGTEGTEPAVCHWFALCDNPANGLRDGGPLGAVPICKRCDDKMDRIAAM